jgi:hypothetical protein
MNNQRVAMELVKLAREVISGDAVKDTAKDMLKLYKKGLSEEDVLKKMEYEDADLLGEAWSLLKKQKKI